MSSSVTGRFPVSSLSEVNGTGRESPTNDATVSDEILMGRLKEGDSEALSLLFQRYSRLVLRTCERILRDEAEAEDLTQDVFLFIQRRCKIFDSSKSTAASWIVQMTYQRAIDRRRRLISRHFYSRKDLGQDDSDFVGQRVLEADHYSPEAVFGRNGMEKVIASLSEDQLETLRLYFFEGYTLAEIGKKLGQPLGNVRHHYYRSLDKLRKQMFGRGGRNRWWQRHTKIGRKDSL